MEEEEDYYVSSDDYDDGSDEDLSGEEEEGFQDDVVEEYPDCPSRTASTSTQVITKQSLLAAQRKDLQTLVDLLHLSQNNARTLLIHHRWDVDRVLAVLVDKGKEQMFMEAGVSVSDCKNSALPRPMSPVTCGVCFDDFSSSDVTMMDCGHSFCNSCWIEHFIVKINDGQSRRIQCMAPKCNTICDEATVTDLLSVKHPEICLRFERFLLESYIEDNNKVKWCPSIPHCGNAIRIDGDDIYREVECSCGKQFCFNCLSEAHSPCSCLMWELWTKKCYDESETVNWITVNTKACPKCHKYVEKNGGCNLVSCVCGQAFCWLCGGATGRDHTWTNIIGHSCGRYEENKIKKAERAKYELHRYVHYYNRYKLHLDSFKLESKLKATIQERISELESKHSQITDYTWILNGLDRLFRSRHVLAYSYPFAFYMFGDDFFKDEMTKEEKEIKKNLFEDQQQQFECNVERLSKLLEEPLQQFDVGKILEIRLHVLNLSALVDRLCLKMYECIENDLLGSLLSAIHNIAPYVSKGIERASEFSASWGSDLSMGSSMENPNLDASLLLASATNRNGGASESGRSGSKKRNPSGANGSGCSTRKRAKKDTHGDALIDLNMPPHMIDNN